MSRPVPDPVLLALEEVLRNCFPNSKLPFMTFSMLVWRGLLKRGFKIVPLTAENTDV